MTDVLFGIDKELQKEWKTNNYNIYLITMGWMEREEINTSLLILIVWQQFVFS